MTRWLTYVLLAALASCKPQLPRPDVPPTRMIEPTLPVSEARADAADAVSLRLLDTQARGHVGLRLLHRRPDGEFVEDATWRWSSRPDRYLDSALHFQAASDPNVRLVDRSDVPSMAATLTVLHLERQGSVLRLVAALELASWPVAALSAFRFWTRGKTCRRSFLAICLLQRAR